MPNDAYHRRHQMETFSVSLAHLRGIHRSPVNSPHRGQWRGASNYFFDLRLNKRLSKQSIDLWFETPSRSLSRHCNGQRPCELFDIYQETEWWLTVRVNACCLTTLKYVVVSNCWFAAVVHSSVSIDLSISISMQQSYKYAYILVGYIIRKLSLFGDLKS